ncbi:MAG: hypothetical protein ACI82I_000166 [Gammaproteobacteria bacterium]|jgi:hypothetical protein
MREFFMPNIGYWNADSDASDAYLADEITTNGHTAVSLPGITISSLSGLDALYLVNYDNDGWNLSAAQIAALDVAVSNGMSLIVFDRNVTDAGDILPGSDGIVFVRDMDSVGQYDVDVANGAPDSFINAVETITDDMFDGGNSSNHGYVTVSSLPQGADVLLTTGVKGNAVAVAYDHGQGNVFYSTIPLDHYSNGPTDAITQAEVAVLAGSAINYALGLEPAFDHAMTVDLFAARGGKVAFMAELALAAYHIDTSNGHEIIQALVNDEKTHGENAYNDLPDGLELLDANDLPALALVNGDVNGFPKDGIANGIYTNENSAALIARSHDALFVAFRGTNDTDSSESLFGSPDSNEWKPTTMGDHFANFAWLHSALEDYVTDNPNIETIYLTGHSLGGAMVEAAMRDGVFDFEGVNVVSVSFASPGFPGSAENEPEHIQSNYHIVGDIVPMFDNSPTNQNSGDITKIHHNLKGQTDSIVPPDIGGEGQDPATVGGTDLHSMQLYRNFVQFFESEKVFKTYQNGIDYDKIIAHGTAINIAEQTYIIGSADDVIYGGSGWEIILGGDGNDVINGQKGNDFIKGGNDNDNDTIWGQTG